MRDSPTEHGRGLLDASAGGRRFRAMCGQGLAQVPEELLEVMALLQLHQSQPDAPRIIAADLEGDGTGSVRRRCAEAIRRTDDPNCCVAVHIRQALGRSGCGV